MSKMYTITIRYVQFPDQQWSLIFDFYSMLFIALRRLARDTPDMSLHPE